MERICGSIVPYIGEQVASLLSGVLVYSFVFTCMHACVCVSVRTWSYLQFWGHHSSRCLRYSYWTFTVFSPTCNSLALLFLFLFFFNFKIFNSHMRSQTWTPLPPPSPQHLSDFMLYMMLENVLVLFFYK